LPQCNLTPGFFQANWPRLPGASEKWLDANYPGYCPDPPPGADGVWFAEWLRCHDADYGFWEPGCASQGGMYLIFFLPGSSPSCAWRLRRS
jgi:hypothetical protein